MLDPEARDSWMLFVEHREAVIAALRNGECDAVLPAAQTFLDGFAAFLLKHNLVEALRSLPDHRDRVTIPAFFFCMTLLHLPLFRMQHLADIKGVLFRSPFILRSLGFNARQIAEGFYSTANGVRPFTAEALADFFVEVSGEELLLQQLRLLRQLRLCFPALFRSGVYSMDCLTVTAPRGKCDLAAARFVVCVLSLNLGKIALPVLWSYAPETGEGTGDVSLGRKLIALSRQRRALMLFYDEALDHRLTKVVSYGQNKTIPEILRLAENLLADIPKDKFDFDRAKVAVMEETSL